MSQIRLDAEFEDILAHNPSASYLELLLIARERGWNLEKLRPEQEVLAAGMPAKKALMLIKAHREFTAANLRTHEQIIPTGTAYQIDAILQSNYIYPLLQAFERHISAHGGMPMELTRIPDNGKLDVQELLIGISRSVLSGISRSQKHGRPAHKIDRYAILTNRCLLRRTFSMSNDGPTNKNQNNQHWHQDSNPIFQNRPMLTIWIPLQEGSGKSIPGIEISELSVDGFVPGLGDEAVHLADVCKETKYSNRNTTVASVGAGGCVAFNGLTFHRTYTCTHMVGLRDALLVRICPEIHASHFPGIRSTDIFFNV